MTSVVGLTALYSSPRTLQPLHIWPGAPDVIVLTVQVLLGGGSIAAKRDRRVPRTGFRRHTWKLGIRTCLHSRYQCVQCFHPTNYPDPLEESTMQERQIELVGEALSKENADGRVLRVKAAVRHALELGIDESDADFAREFLAH